VSRNGKRTDYPTFSADPREWPSPHWDLAPVGTDTPALIRRALDAAMQAIMADTANPHRLVFENTYLRPTNPDDTD
jgi:hypothetical protein